MRFADLGLVVIERDDTSPLLELRRKRRIAFRCHLLMWPRLRRLPPLRLYMYLSHKLLRWFSGWLAAGAGVLLLAVAAAAFPLVTVAAVIVAAAGAATGAAALRRHPGASGPLARSAAIAGAFAYTSLGVLDALRGRTYATWAPVRTAA